MENDDSEVAYMIVIEIAKSPFQPHAKIQARTKKPSSDFFTVYNIRIDKFIRPDTGKEEYGRTGKMSNKQILKEMERRALRIKENKDETYGIYGYSASHAFDLCY